MKRLAMVMIILGLLVLATVLVWQWRHVFFPEVQGEPVPGASTRPAAWLDRIGWVGTPGPLSLSHRGLSSACQDCHEPFRRVLDLKCLSCHARNVALLTRHDTAFHAAATRCMTCHTEHQGRGARISRMEHGALDPSVTCSTCHVDRHKARFGDQCVECHAVDTWRIAGFRHPSASSMACWDCHSPPPSHLMMHFAMVDQAVTGRRSAKVEQCWQCHTTDHWNNIVGVGFYKHH